MKDPNVALDRGTDVDVVEAGRSQRQRANTEIGEDRDDLGVERVVDEDAHGIGALGAWCGGQVELRFEEPQVMMRAGRCQVVLIPWVRRVDGDDHGENPLARWPVAERIV
jgi:hypothetical protein